MVTVFPVTSDWHFTGSAEHTEMAHGVPRTKSGDWRHFVIGHGNFKELVAKMSPERQARIKVEADELVNLNDSFPDGKFDWCRWSAESVEGVSAIRALLDSFHLVGKRIANVWTESYDFFNTKGEIEEEVFSDLVDRLGFTEEAARAGSSIQEIGRAHV